MTGDFHARVLDDVGSWTRNTVLLAVRERRGMGAAYLMRDGTWLEFTPEEGSALRTDIGIELPRGSIEAVALAIQEWQGHTSHADTEARVLREWLAVERERTDRTLAVSR